MKKALALFLIVAGCTPIVNSTISPIHDKTGAMKGKMDISFTSNFDNDGKVTAVTSDGEVFNGSVIGEKSARAAEDFYDASAKYYSKAEAVLISNRNNSMKCIFTLAEPIHGITAGAVGECKISDGRKVPVALSGSTRKLQ